MEDLLESIVGEIYDEYDISENRKSPGWKTTCGVLQAVRKLNF
jgi:Mg2+/Co2+ transporter CorC